MDVQQEVEFLNLLNNKVNTVAHEVAVRGTLEEVIAMIKGRIHQLLHDD